MNIEDRIKIAILNKYYGNLLTEKQKQVLYIYVDNNLSLAEVSAELKITRQAVKDSLDTAVASLEKAENDLHFIQRDDRIKKLLEEKPLSQIDMQTRLEILSLLED